MDTASKMRVELLVSSVAGVKHEELPSSGSSRWESEKRDEDVGGSLQGTFERTVPEVIPEMSGMCKKSFQSLSLSKLYCFSLLQLYSKALRLYS